MGESPRSERDSNQSPHDRVDLMSVSDSRASGKVHPMTLKNRSARLSRRLLLSKIVSVIGGVAILSASMVRGALAKATQKVAGYQDTPKGDLRCDNCSQFEPPASCKVVDGNISPAGWCKVYIKKSPTR